VRQGLTAPGEPGGRGGETAAGWPARRFGDRILGVGAASRKALRSGASSWLSRLIGPGGMVGMSVTVLLCTSAVAAC